MHASADVERGGIGDRLWHAARDAVHQKEITSLQDALNKAREEIDEGKKASATHAENERELEKVRAELLEARRQLAQRGREADDEARHNSTATSTAGGAAEHERSQSPSAVRRRGHRAQSASNPLDSSEVLRNENKRLSGELHQKSWYLKRLETDQEKEVGDLTDFITCLAASSSRPILDDAYDLRSADILGMGRYGYVMACDRRGTSEKVVLKLQSSRWVNVAAKEWASGFDLGSHPHLVGYLEVYMHSDLKRVIERRLIQGFESGQLDKKRPKVFPGTYYVMVLEHCDGGTLQGLMERRALSTEDLAAITCQAASALAFMHGKRRTHNDVKPENILLQSSKTGDELVVKLADLGLAAASVDRQRDDDLFAYSLYCLALRKTFRNCPASPAARAEAVQALRSALAEAAAQEAQEGGCERAEALVEVVSGLWSHQMDFMTVATRSEFEGCKVAARSEFEDCKVQDRSSKS